MNSIRLPASHLYGVSLFACLVCLPFHLNAAPPVSIGAPQNGALLNPKKLTNSAYLNVREGRNYGTTTLVRVIEGAIEHVHRHHPETPKLYVGDLSDHDGGHLAKHVSHQSGRDADIAYFKDGPLHQEDRLVNTLPSDLDLYRTWTLMAYLLDHSDVQAIYSDTAIIQALHEHARSAGHSEPELLRWFGPKVGAPYSGSKLRHTDGHTTHFHLRVRSKNEHRSWASLKSTMPLAEWNALKSKTSTTVLWAAKLDQKASEEATLLVSSAPKEAVWPPRRRSRSPSQIAARRRAQHARLRAKLLASETRARHLRGAHSNDHPSSNFVPSQENDSHQTKLSADTKHSDRVTQGHESKIQVYEIPAALKATDA